MRTFTAAVVVAALVLTSIPAWSQTSTSSASTVPTKPIGTCEALARDWQSIEYELADNYAEGIVDDSAPRATMRAARNTEAYVRAEITLNLMQANKCALPKRAPSEITYSLSAMKCRTEMLKANYKAPECDRSTWTPLVPSRGPDDTK